MHHSIGIYGRGINGQFCSPVSGIPGRDHADSPELAVLVVKGASVACSYSKTGGFKCKRVVFGICVRTHGTVRYIYSMGVRKEFKTNGGILQIVFALVFGYPRTFNPWEFFFIIYPSPVKNGEDDIVVTSVLKAVVLVITKEKNLGAGYLFESIDVQFYCLEWHNL